MLHNATEKREKGNEGRLYVAKRNLPVHVATGGGGGPEVRFNKKTYTARA